MTGRAAVALALAPLAARAGALEAAVGRRARGPGRLRVVLAAPGADAIAGAELGAAEGARAASLVRRALDLQAVAAGADGVAAAIRALDGAPADAVVGGADATACRALADAAARAGAVYVNAWCADDALRVSAAARRTTFHVAPADAQRLDAVVGALAGDALGHHWVIVGGDAGAARARALLAARGAVVVEHLAAATVDAAAAARLRGTAVLVADSSPPSLAAGGRLARAIAPALVVAASALGAPVAHLHAASWDATLERFGAEQLNARYRARVGREMTEEAWTGWAALKLVADAWLRPDARALAEALGGPRPFDANKGRALAFRAADGQLVQPLYVVRAGADGAREVIREVAPDGGRAPARGRA